MPRTTVLFYQEAPRNVPVLEWLRELRRADRRGYAKCVARIQRLAEVGHELRARRGRIHYRILYFFHGRHVVVLACGLTKESSVPDAEVDRALRRRAAFEKDPDRHTFEAELGDDV